MKKTILALVLLLCATTHAADVKISSLPLGTASATGTNDSFPYVDAGASTTRRLKLSDLINLPSIVSNYAPLASPTFTGVVTAPSFVGNLTGNASGSALSFTGPLVGDVTGTQGATAISSSTVTSKLITGFVQGAGTVAASDSILQALNKIDGNVAGKQPTGNYVTALTGDVTAAGPGSVAATVVTVGGSTATEVNDATELALAATAVATPDTLVLRDGSGDFSANEITADLAGDVVGSLTGNVLGDVTGNLLGNVTGNVSGSAATFTGNLVGDVTGTQGATAISASTVTGKLLTGFVSGAGVVAATDTILQSINKLDGNVSGKQASGDYITALTGDVTAAGPGSVAGTVAFVGGSTGAAVGTATVLANAATDANTASAIVKRDGSGNFTAGTVSATAVAVSSATLTQIATPANPSAGFNKLYTKSTDRLYLLNSAGTETEVGSGGGGGGASIIWDEQDAAPSSEVSSLTSQILSYLFIDQDTQYLYAIIKVPANYVVGKQINLRLVPNISDMSGGTFLLQSRASLIRPTIDDMSGLLNSRTSTNSAITSSASPSVYTYSVVCDLTSTSGQINGVSVSPGDIIKIRLTRDTSTDTSTRPVVVPAHASEVTFND